MKYNALAKYTQTPLTLNCSHLKQLEAGSIAQAYPRLVLTISQESRRWDKEKLRFVPNTPPESCIDQVNHMLKTLIWKLSIDLDPYFIEHCNGLDLSQPFEIFEGMIHCVLHRDGDKVYALDVLQWRSDEAPYGLRICSLARHAK